MENTQSQCVGAPDYVTAQLAEGLQLVVAIDKPVAGNVLVEIEHGTYPHGNNLVRFWCPVTEASVSTKTTVPTLWFGHANIKLPWLELLKVADYLRLPIDVPPTEVVEAVKS